MEQSPEQGNDSTKVKPEAAKARQVIPMGCEIGEPTTIWVHKKEDGAL